MITDKYLKIRALAVLVTLISGLQAKALDSVIVVGIEPAPPFVEIADGPSYLGLSFAFWGQVEDKAQLKFEYKSFDNLPDLLDAVKSGEVDMSINPVTVTDERMHELDFSQPFFISGTAFVKKSTSNWWEVIKNVFSWEFVSALMGLLFIIMVFGLLVWYFERKKNPEQFKKGWRGIGDGFWWSAVTMTTVGYGDKAPVSRAGRMVGFVWMFASIIMISGLTAGIASALTVQSMDSKISSAEDLKRFRVATVGGSSTEDYLHLFDIKPYAFEDVSVALDALEDDEVDVVVYDRPMLRYFIKVKEMHGVTLSAKNLKTDYYSFTFPRGSALGTYLDPYVVSTLKSPQWTFKLKTLDDREP